MKEFQGKFSVNLVKSRHIVHWGVHSGPHEEQNWVSRPKDGVPSQQDLTSRVRSPFCCHRWPRWLVKGGVIYNIRRKVRPTKTPPSKPITINTSAITVSTATKWPSTVMTSPVTKLPSTIWALTVLNPNLSCTRRAEIWTALSKIVKPSWIHKPREPDRLKRPWNHTMVPWLWSIRPLPRSNKCTIARATPVSFNLQLRMWVEWASFWKNSNCKFDITC